MSPKTSNFTRIHVARIDQIFQDQGLAECTIYHVARNSRTGPWQARVWEVMLDSNGNVLKEVISEEEFVCPVVLINGALDNASLESLYLAGVPAVGQPRRDAALPPREH